MAFARVREDKEREAGDGFDGTWVAHPGLVPVAMEIFDRVLGERPNQKDRQRDDVVADAAKLVDLSDSPQAFQIIPDWPLRRLLLGLVGGCGMAFEGLGGDSHFLGFAEVEHEGFLDPVGARPATGERR